MILDLPNIDSPKELYFDIYGGIKNPGRYEYRKNDVLEFIIQISGGYSENVGANGIITRLGHNQGINIILEPARQSWGRP